jgi:hypothetical protein
MQGEAASRRHLLASENDDDDDDENVTLQEIEAQALTDLAKVNFNLDKFLTDKKNEFEDFVARVPGGLNERFVEALSRPRLPSSAPTGVVFEEELKSSSVERMNYPKQVTSESIERIMAWMLKLNLLSDVALVDDVFSAMRAIGGALFKDPL